MARSRGSGGAEGRRGRSQPRERSASGRREAGTIEGLFQELVRRTAALGLSSFFLTEEAIRKALSEKVPPDWVEYAARQSGEMRRELIDRIVAEFGAWLRQADPETLQRGLLQTLLEHYDFTIEIDISAHPRSDPRAPSLRVVPRRR